MAVRPALIFAAMALAGTASPVLARSSTAAGVATATVIRPLTVAATADMDFGTITHLPGTGGSVTVTPGAAGATFAGGAGAGCAGADCAAAHAAHFAVNGEPQRNYSIQLPASVTATGTASVPGTIAPSLVVGNLTMRSTNGGSNPRIDATGAGSFEVGGTITLPADLPAARYRASFAVMVTYI